MHFLIKFRYFNKVHQRQTIKYSLRRRVPVCFLNYENLPYLYFDSRYYIKNAFCEYEDIHQQVFTPKFYENLMLSGELIQLLILLTPTLKLNQLPSAFIFTEEIFYILFQSNDMANFHYLLGKLKPLTLIIKCLCLMDFTEMFKFN